MATLNELINSDTPVLVNFFAEWSDPCKTMGMILKEFKRQKEDDIKVVKLDVDKYPKVAKHFKVTGVPTFMIFKNGEIKWKKAGIRTVPQLIEALEGIDES